MKKINKRILVICLPGLGDVLMFTPTLLYLKKIYPDSKIDALVMFKASKEVLEHTNLINNIYIFNFMKENKLKGIKFALNLRKNKYDISYLAFPAFRREYHLIHWLCGATERIAHRFNKGYFSQLNFLNTKTFEVNESVHNVVNNLRFLSEPKAINSQINYIYNVKQKEKKIAQNFINSNKLTFKKLICIHPGAMSSMLGSKKRWSSKKWAQFINLINKHNYQILVFSGPEDKKDVEEIQKNCIKPIVIAENLPLSIVAAIMEQSEYMVANDSGLAHLAAAFKHPKIITLFGPTNPIWCSPYRDNDCFVLSKTKNKPWYRYEMNTKIPKQQHDSQDMDAIKVEDLMEYFK